MPETPQEIPVETITVIILVFAEFCRVFRSEESMKQYLLDNEGKLFLKESYVIETVGNFEEKSIEIYHLYEFLAKGSYKIISYINYLPYFTQSKGNNVH